MTQVNLKYRRIDGSNLDGTLVTVGAVTITPLARRDTTAGQMTTAELLVPLAPTAPTVVLSEGTYRFRVKGPGLDNTEVRLVPASGGPYDVDDLDEVTPTGDVALEPEWKAYIDAAIAGVAAGNVTPSGITGSTAIGQALIVAASQSSARTTIDAAAATHAHAVGDITATGTPSNTTFLRGDGTWSGTPAAGNPDWADITGKPTFFPTESAEIDDATAVGLALLTAADADAARTAISAMGVGEELTDANQAPASVMFASGASTPRPTSRTDVMVLWLAASAPTNAVAGDVWLNGPDA